MFNVWVVVQCLLHISVFQIMIARTSKMMKRFKNSVCENFSAIDQSFEDGALNVDGMIFLRQKGEMATPDLSCLDFLVQTPSTASLTQHMYLIICTVLFCSQLCAARNVLV